MILVSACLRVQHKMTPCEVHCPSHYQYYSFTEKSFCAFTNVVILISFEDNVSLCYLELILGKSFCIYHQTCLMQPVKGLRKTDLWRQVTVQYKSICHSKISIWAGCYLSTVTTKLWPYTQFTSTLTWVFPSLSIYLTELLQ